jgi:hypothetical protein
MLDVIDLALLGPSRDLIHGFGQMRHAVESSLAKAPAICVHGQLATNMGNVALDELPRFPSGRRIPKTQATKE